MTEPERDDVPSDEVANQRSAGDLEGDSELAGDDSTDAAHEVFEADDEPIQSETATEVGDPNDALPTSGARPGTIGAGAAGRSGRAGRAARQASTATRTVAPTPSEVAVHIDDRVSMVFVGLVVAAFVGIFAFGVLLGGYGVFGHRPTPLPPPAPTVTAPPTASPSAAPSASAAPSESASAAPSGSASAAPAASPSAAPSGSPAPSST